MFGTGGTCRQYSNMFIIRIYIELLCRKVVGVPSKITYIHKYNIRLVYLIFDRVSLPQIVTEWHCILLAINYYGEL